MPDSRGFYMQMRDVLRERLLDATARLICSDGWSAVTMARVADEVGVSRQSVYKEIGSRAELGEAVIARETGRVLDGVLAQLREHGDDALAGIPAAAQYVLHTGAGNPLVKAILVGAQSGDDLLPLLAVQPGPVLTRAIEVVSAEAAERYAGLLAARDIGRLSEVVVRLTLSHLMQPTGPAQEAVAQVRALIEAALRPPPG